MNPRLVDLLSQYMTKMGSITQDTKTLLGRMYKYIDKQDQVKTASVAAHRDRADALAYKMSQTRLPSGAPLIEGHEIVKQASLMLSDHDQTLNVLEMVLNSVVEDHTKHAAVEPGYPYSIPATGKEAEDKLSADDWLVSTVLGPNALHG
jgi:hypothetical protein